MKCSGLLRLLSLTFLLTVQAGAHAQNTPAPALPVKAKPDHLKQESAARAALRRKIGQLIITGFQGSDRSHRSVKRLGQQIRRGEVGGVLFLGYNIPRSGADIRDLLAFFTEHQSAGGQPGLLVALDQEGGKIQRLKPWHGIKRVPSAQNMAKRNEREAFKAYRQLACDLKDLGFNWNLGPVVDLAANPKNPVITRLQRAYSADPHPVARYAGAFVRAHTACGVATSLKHFPGHGSSGADSHKGPADISATWSKTELEPYRALAANSGLGTVMTGHLMHRGIDPDRPASLSHIWIDATLRGALGYDGPVVTDDLDMRAVSALYTSEQAAVQALLAGNDFILIANSLERLPHLPRLVANAILDEIETGANGLTPERLHKSFQRVETLKKKLGLM